MSPTPRKNVPGIDIRHSRSCASRSGGKCNCSPSYQAHVWSRRDNTRIRKTFPTLAAAKSWRIDAQKGLREGKLRAPTRDTVRQAGEALIAGMKDGSIRRRGGKPYKPATIRSYEQSLRNHVYPELGRHKLSDVLFPDLQDLVDDLAADGLDGSTIRNAINPLRVIYRRNRYAIPVNPTTGLELPALGNKPKRVVSADVAVQMIDTLEKGDRALRATAFYAGLRNGELQALRIERIELFPEGRWGLIHVLEGWDKMEGAQDPKSAAGTRTVPVCEQLYEILEDHLLRLGRDTGLAFGRNADTPYSYSAVRARAKRAFKHAKLEPSDLQLHECRHSYKSWLEDIGIPDSRIDRYLGHSDGSVQRRYSHQLDHQYLEDAQALTDYVRRAVSPTRGDQVRDSRATVRDSS